MAKRTLTLFRAELEAMLGNLSLGTTKIDRWLNDAYLDLAGGVDFAALQDIDTTTTATIGQANYAVPSGTLTVQAVFDEANDSALEYVTPEEYYRRRSTTNGNAEVWTRIGDEIYLSPPPDATDAITILRKAAPTALSGANDTSAFPEIWDPVILHLAAFYGMMARNEEDRAMVFMQSAINYIQTRITEEEEYIQARGLGLAIAPVEPAPAPTTGVTL